MSDNKEGDWEYWKKQNYYIVDKILFIVKTK